MPLPGVTQSPLANEFCWTFARMEYALKAEDFREGAGNGERDAKASWAKFAKESGVRNALTNPTSQELKVALGYIAAQPPMKQIVKDNLLQWKPEPAKQTLSAQQALVYVCRVRNNLFHGGKFKQGDGWLDPQRTDDLLRHGLTILKASRDACAKVARTFDD
jgi:hypothetical protein